jgi:hypothetical protein
MKKNILIYAIGLILLAIVSTLIYLYITGGEKEIGKEISKDNFSITYTYQGNSEWEYTVTGTLPNSCYSADVTAMVAESYPEQVTVQVKVSNNSPELCAEMIQDFKYTGSFNASEKATVTLSVVE